MDGETITQGAGEPDIEKYHPDTLMNNLDDYIINQYAEVKKASLKLNTSTIPATVNDNIESLRIETIEFYGLIVFTFSKCKDVLDDQTDINKYNIYWSLLSTHNMEDLRRNIDGIKDFSLFLLKVFKVNRLNSVKKQVDMMTIG